MAGRHLTRRTPQQRGRYAWSRTLMVARDGGLAVRYRLFRRDLKGLVRMEARTFQLGELRSCIAQSLRQARRILRERVDDVDLAILGVTA
jgi:hypothetical protein